MVDRCKASFKPGLSTLSTPFSVSRDFPRKTSTPLCVCRKCPVLLNFDWLFRFWQYFDTIPHGVSWLACAGFVFGEALYVIGAFSGDATNTVINVRGNCMRDRYDWLVTFTYFLGDVCWVPAVFCMIFEAINKDFEGEVKEWRLSDGDERRKPRYRWFGVWWWELEWWGAVCYFGGVAGYLTSSTTAIVSDCTYINPTLHLWLSAYTNIGAGVLFLLAGALYSMAFIHPWLLPAIFLPYTKEDWSSLVWWAMWTHWWGGACFFMTGIFQYWYNDVADNLTDKVYLIEQSIGFGYGSLLFHIGGVLLLAGQSRERFLRPPQEKGPAEQQQIQATV